MNAYIIDPFFKTISPAEHAGDYPSVLSLLGCAAFDSIELPGGDAIYYDAAGFTKGSLYDPMRDFFLITIDGAQYLASGTAMIVGTTEDGGDAAPGNSLDSIAGMISWVSISLVPDIIEFAERHGVYGNGIIKLPWRLIDPAR